MPKIDDSGRVLSLTFSVSHSSWYTCTCRIATCNNRDYGIACYRLFITRDSLSFGVLLICRKINQSPLLSVSRFIPPHRLETRSVLRNSKRSLSALCVMIISINQHAFVCDTPPFSTYLMIDYAFNDLDFS